jgi:hypothetical protein
MPRIMYNSFAVTPSSCGNPHYAVVGVRILIVTFSCFFLYLLAGESRPMVGFSPGLILESEGRTSCGLSVENVLVKVAFSV